jgi:hypothetical protein
MTEMLDDYWSFSARCTTYQRGTWTATMLCTPMKSIFLDSCRFPRLLQPAVTSSAVPKKKRAIDTGAYTKGRYDMIQSQPKVCGSERLDMTLAPATPYSHPHPTSS